MVRKKFAHFLEQKFSRSRQLALFQFFNTRPLTKPSAWLLSLICRFHPNRNRTNIHIPNHQKPPPPSISSLLRPPQPSLTSLLIFPLVFLLSSSTRLVAKKGHELELVVSSAMDRSKSYAPGRMQIEPYYGPGGGSRPDFRSYSYSAGGGMGMSSYSYQYEYGGGGGGAGGVGPAADGDLKRSKSSKRRWLALADPDMERKRRVASYKAYAVEGKVKGSFRKSFKWIKDRYLHLVYGWS